MHCRIPDFRNIAAAGAVILLCTLPVWPQSAIAQLVSCRGDSTGVAEFTQTDSGVVIRLNLKGLPPGLHGLHIHADGVCTPPDFKSAGAHFNPSKKRHGFLDPQGPHAGDLPNIEVGSDGTLTDTIRTKLVSLRKGDNASLRARPTALVIHAHPDDYVSDPAGTAGDRIACGVIRESGTNPR